MEAVARVVGGVTQKRFNQSAFFVSCVRFLLLEKSPCIINIKKIMRCDVHISGYGMANTLKL